MQKISKSEILGFDDSQTFTISAKQSDVGRCIDIIFMDGLFLFDFSDAKKIVLSWQHENGTYGNYAITDFNTNTSSACVELTSDLLKKGIVKCDIEFIDADDCSVTTTAFAIIVGGNNA